MARNAKAKGKALAPLTESQLAGIREIISEGDLSAAVQALREGLSAKMRVRAGKTALGMQYEDIPDHAIRITSARLLIEFGDGKAIQRIHQHNTGDQSPRLTPREIFGRLAQDGEHMVSLLKAYVDVAKESQTKKVEEVIDLPTLTDLEA